MNIAKRNVNGLIKILEEEQKKGMNYMSTLVTSNYNTNCYAFTKISEVINTIKQYESIHLNRHGIWDSKQNNLDFSDSIGNIHMLYTLAREKKYIK